MGLYGISWPDEVFSLPTYYTCGCWASLPYLGSLEESFFSQPILSSTITGKTFTVFPTLITIWKYHKFQNYQIKQFLGFLSPKLISRKIWVAQKLPKFPHCELWTLNFNYTDVPILYRFGAINFPSRRHKMALKTFFKAELIDSITNGIDWMYW